MPLVLRSPVALLLVCFLVLLCASTVEAQATPARVEGFIELAGQPVADASVTLTSPGFSYSARADTHGRFTLVVEPGRYTVEVSAPGARPLEWREIEAQPGEHLRLVAALSKQDSALPEAAGTPPGLARADATTAFSLSDPLLGRLPLDRNDALRATAELFPGMAYGSALGAGAETATTRRVDGMDLSDPLDGREWSSYIATTAEQFAVRAASAPATEGGAAAAIIDVVTRAGGRQLSGLFDARITAEGLDTDNLSEELLGRNPLLADADRLLSNADVSAWLGGPLGHDRASIGVGIGYTRQRDDPTGPRTVRESSTPRVQGRLAFRRSAGEVLTGAVFYEDRSASGLAPVDVERVVTDTVANRLDGRTIAARGVWQRAFSASLLRASYSLFDGSKDLAPETLVPGHVDGATGEYTGSLGGTEESNRLRQVLGVSVAVPLYAAGVHTLETGVELEATSVGEAARFVDDRFYIDFGGRPNLEVDWAGSDREGRNRRLSAYGQDGWTIGKRLTINAGVRLDYVRGSTPELGTVYDATTVQPRMGATFTVDRNARTVARAHFGQYAEPLWFSHFDRATPGVAPVVFYEVLPNGSRREIDRTVTPVYSVDTALRHPRSDEASLGVTHQITARASIGATAVFRERRRFVDAVFPDARWVSIVRLGFDASPITVYRWANRVASEGNALIRNMDSIEYFAPNGTRIGAASAARRYRGVIVDGRYGDARGRVGVWGSWTFAQNEGTVDDTFAENISRSGRFESPSASLVNVDGRATTTSAHKLSVLATALIPWIGARVSAVYVGRSGRRYAATRQFGNETLDFPQSEDGRQVLLETRGARELPFDHELDLRGEYALRFGRHSIGLYVDVINLVNDATVLDVESLYPLASAGGSGIVRFEAPTRVRSPRQLYVGGRWGF